MSKPEAVQQTIAQARMAQFAHWFALNCATKRTPLGDETSIGPWAMIVAVNPEAPVELEFEPGAFPIFVPTIQAEGLALPAFDTTTPDSQPSLFDRIWQLAWRVSAGTLPPAVIIDLNSPTDSIANALARVGASGVDLTVMPVLAIPVWVLPPSDRRTLSGKLPMVPATF